MTKTFIAMGLLLGLGVLAGCSAETDTETGEAVAKSTCVAEGSARPRGLTLNGPTLNGISLNGWSLNGWSLNGWSLNGIQFNGIAMNGISLQGTTLNGISLQGTTLNGVGINGPAIQGTELAGQMSDGSTIPFFIDEVRANPDPKNADVTLYAVSVGADRQALCGRDEGGAPILATALGGTWDGRTGARIDSADRFTFACQGGALYKCVDAGYKPWTSAEMAEYHQACTRMIRADYCGDGRSFTKDGTMIDMGDALGVQSFATTSRADFAFEATWGPNGATCVEKTRFRLPHVPSCLADRLKDSCDGATTEGGVKLANRSTATPACIQ
jgi:uncharacterized protein YjbI with pentapeptide repeats